LLDCAGDILGVLENELSSPTDALVVTTEELVILNKKGPIRVRYDAIADMDHLVKEPTSEAITVHLHSGETVSIPARLPEGAAFTLWQFLISARHDVK
jgi:hypothetical protein